jgi:DNA-binding NarL/FixJ family response regulator
LFDALQCIAVGAQSVDETQTSAHNSALNKRKTILIADDSAMVRAVIREAIQRDTDFVVCGEAADGTEAVTKAKELSPDLVILDVRMPGLNGLEVASILRYALPHLRIALVTMYAEDLGRNFTSLFRIDAVLAKANGLTELTAHVTRILADREPGIATPGETLTAV